MTRHIPMLLLACVAITGCEDSDLDELADEIIALEATGYMVCAIDRLGSLKCMSKDDNSELDMADMAGFDYVDLASTQTTICAVRDNDGSGSGDIHCFSGSGPAFHDTHEGNFTEVTARNAPCGLEDGEIICFDPPEDADFVDLPAGPFTEIWDFASGTGKSLLAVAADGSLTTHGNEYFGDMLDTCPLPSAGVVDIDVGPGPLVLTDDGMLTGWWGWGFYEEDCLSIPVASDAFAVSFTQEGPCTLEGSGSVSCLALEGGEDEGIVENVPTGTNYEHITTYGGWGALICVSAGSEVTCWGDSWLSDTTFEFTN